MTSTHFVTVQLGSGDTRSVLVLDLGKLCFLTYNPETKQQTAKLVLDFGASEKMFEKEEAEQVYQALARHPAIGLSAKS